jgi:hypothetical protein
MGGDRKLQLGLIRRGARLIRSANTQDTDPFLIIPSSHECAIFTWSGIASHPDDISGISTGSLVLLYL